MRGRERIITGWDVMCTAHASVRLLFMHFVSIAPE